MAKVRRRGRGEGSRGRPQQGQGHGSVADLQRKQRLTQTHASAPRTEKPRRISHFRDSNLATQRPSQGKIHAASKNYSTLEMDQTSYEGKSTPRSTGTEHQTTGEPMESKGGRDVGDGAMQRRTSHRSEGDDAGGGRADPETPGGGRRARGMGFLRPAALAPKPSPLQSPPFLCAPFTPFCFCFLFLRGLRSAFFLGVSVLLSMPQGDSAPDGPHGFGWAFLAG